MSTREIKAVLLVYAVVAVVVVGVVGQNCLCDVNAAPSCALQTNCVTITVLRTHFNKSNGFCQAWTTNWAAVWTPNSQCGWDGNVPISPYGAITLYPPNTGPVGTNCWSGYIFPIGYVVATYCNTPYYTFWKPLQVDPRCHTITTGQGYPCN